MTLSPSLDSSDANLPAVCYRVTTEQVFQTHTYTHTRAPVIKQRAILWYQSDSGDVCGWEGMIVGLPLPPLR